MIGIAIASLVLGGASLFSNIFFGNKQRELQERQYQLEQQKYYDDMQSSYYEMMQSLESMRQSQSDSMVAKNQAYEDIAGNQLYLDRWQDEYDSTMQQTVSEAYSMYDEQRSALGLVDVSAAETGRVGGSVEAISRAQKRNLMKVTGTADGFNLEDNLLSRYLNATGQDLLAERQTASTAIQTGYDSIAAYQDAIRIMQENIDSMTATSEEMRKTLIENGRTV